MTVIAPTDWPAARAAFGPRAARLLAEIATKQQGEAARISTTMFAAYAVEIPAYRQISDPALREDVQSVSAAVVRCWLNVVSRGEPPQPQDLQPLLQGARRRAAQGIDLHSLLRAYRVGIRVMWKELVTAPEWQSRALQTAVTQIAEWALDFADRVSTEVAAAYLDELAHVTREREHRRSALLNVILAGPGGEAVDGLTELDRPHAIVVGRVSEDRTLAELEATGMRLETEAGALLWTVRHRSVIAAVALPGESDRAELIRLLAQLLPDSGVDRFGVGGNARGAQQTRQSYAEASDTLRVGPVLSFEGGPVYDYQELAPAIALLARPDQARRFVATALEPIDALLDRAWVLPTLEAFISRQGRVKEAASLLGVHLNTVKYRLRELRAAIGPLLNDGDRAGTLLLALRLRRLLDAENS